ncbi:hypothetical protein PX52LOC_06349 [Limnoglobus roseus]|uniref:Uncharacterized protein n=2 Tax=Limnoglobus roseus TaxID=2598579 RepID=A0A5C1AMS9_9BACT|nr:hypothetical protein PX52LOC_06349 [Limnoglobus roseus]
MRVSAYRAHLHDGYLPFRRTKRDKPLVYAVQGYESILGAFPGGHAEDKVDALVGNLASIFVALPTPRTAKWVCEGMGRERKFTTSSSTSFANNSGSSHNGGPDGPQVSASVSEIYEAVIQPSELFRMRTGSARHGFKVDCLHIKAGTVFPSTGYNFVPVTFTQERL